LDFRGEGIKIASHDPSEARGRSWPSGRSAASSWAELLRTEQAP
jgi:hypothetical protein